MRIRQIFESPINLIASFCITAALAQSSASTGDEESNKLVTQGLEQKYGSAKTSFILQKPRPGSAVSGVEIARTSNTVYIDSTPCSTDQPKRIFAFVKPYAEGKVSNAVCSSKSYPQIQVIQE